MEDVEKNLRAIGIRVRRRKALDTSKWATILDSFWPFDDDYDHDDER